MCSRIASSPRRSTNSFEQVVSGFLKQSGLPFSEVLTADVIEAVFRQLVVITTLTDINEFSKEDIAEIYGYRWNVELDVRSLK